MNTHFTNIILKSTGASSIAKVETIQRLWSGYGKIVRCSLVGSAQKNVVAKHVHWPDAGHHPRGWNSNLGHERKVKSYQVETAWYAQYADCCTEACRIPHCLGLETHGDEVFMVLEDLDAAGFNERRACASDTDVKACLSWLAHFHASFLGTNPDGLWETGTYWHLSTRPEELDELTDQKLKTAAAAIDRRLKDSPFQTLVHGDAKLANFCFSADEGCVAAVDFQYVGGGCGMKDVAYFISSCLNEDESERQEQALLDYYFQTLGSALKQSGNDIDFVALEADWRALYPVAWTDFYRFLQGWCPGHWKIHRYSERLAREILEQL